MAFLLQCGIETGVSPSRSLACLIFDHNSILVTDVPAFGLLCSRITLSVIAEYSDVISTGVVPVETYCVVASRRRDSIHTSR